MFFQDHEKQIYSPPGCDQKFDPLALDRALTKASGGRLNEWLQAWSPESEGDVSAEGKRKTSVEQADAEELLVEAARKAFGLPPFPESTSAQALEYLLDYLWWMEGKGVRATR